MTTLGDRVAARDHDEFVGRRELCDLFERLLDGREPFSVALLHGPGGIGKSTLLRRVARMAAERGRGPVVIDGRDLPPVSDALELVLVDIVAMERPLVIFDSYERLQALDGYLRARFLPSLPADAVVIVSGRAKPGEAWFSDGWERLARAIPMEGLGVADAAELVRRAGVDDQAARSRLVDWAQGSPLALALGAGAASTGAVRPGGHPLDEASLAALVERLIDREAEPARRNVLAVAALARVITADALRAALPGVDATEAFGWLAGCSFIEPLADGLALHSLVARAFRDDMRRRDPIGEANLRRRLTDHFHERALRGDLGMSADLSHLVATDAMRWGYSLDSGSRYRVDGWQPGDERLLSGALERAGAGAVWRQIAPMVAEAPACVGLVRDHDDRLKAYILAVTPATAPPAAWADPQLGPWLEHARADLGSSNAVLWHDTAPIAEDADDAYSLIGMAGMLRSGLANPRYCYMPITPGHDEARGFAEAIGARRIDGLGRVAAGRPVDCYLMDFGPGGVVGFQRDWIYHELGLAPTLAPPAGMDPEVLREGLLGLRDPARLAGHPLAIGSTRAEWADAVRRAVVVGLESFGETADERTLRAIIERAYLGERSGHDAVARGLYLSRSSYFRRLRTAIERLAEVIRPVPPAPPG